MTPIVTSRLYSKCQIYDELTLSEIKERISKLYLEVREKTNEIDALIAQWEGLSQLSGECIDEN